MRVRHTIASGLVAILLTQVSGLAQSISEPAATHDEIVKVPQPEALYRLFEALISSGSEQRVRFEIQGGEILEGSVVELSPDTITISGGRGRVVPLASIVGLRPRKTKEKPGMSNGSAFAIGAGAGSGIVMSLVLIALAHMK